MQSPQLGWLYFFRRLEQLSALAALCLALLEFGLIRSAHELGSIHVLLTPYAGLFVLRLVWELGPTRIPWRDRIFELALALSALACCVAAASSDAGFASAWMRGLYLPLALQVLRALAFVQERFSRGTWRPALFLAGSLALLAVLGALLLMLPAARPAGVRAWSFEEAFFTAASAVSVTGLSLRDVGSELSFRGQVLLLALIQLGGLGLVSLIASASILDRGRLRLQELRFLGESIGADAPGRARRFLGFLLVFTVLVEALGALLLWRATEGLDLGPHPRWWWCCFHAVSAFCNAGFGLSSQSITPWATQGGILWIIAALVIAGGLGFGVHRDLLLLRPLSLDRLRWLRWRLESTLWWPWRKQSFEIPVQHRLQLGTKLVLLTTALLLAIGTLVFRFSESAHTLAQQAGTERWLLSFFHSAMARTAGFNALDLSLVAPGTMFVLMVLMAIGASPISTGGGLKTSTIAVAGLAVRAMARDREQVDAFGRSIPRSTVNAAMAIMLIYSAGIVLVVGLLLWTQPGLELDRAAFEGISAFATVGWSVGVTAEVDSAGRWILSFAMILGRIGPLAILMTFVARRQRLEYRYPEAPMSIG